MYTDLSAGLFKNPQSHLCQGIYVYGIYSLVYDFITQNHLPSLDCVFFLSPSSSIFRRPNVDSFEIKNISPILRKSKYNNKRSHLSINEILSGCCRFADSVWIFSQIFDQTKVFVYRRKIIRTFSIILRMRVNNNCIFRTGD